MDIRSPLAVRKLAYPVPKLGPVRNPTPPVRILDGQYNECDYLQLATAYLCNNGTNSCDEGDHWKGYPSREF